MCCRPRWSSVALTHRSRKRLRLVLEAKHNVGAAHGRVERDADHEHGDAAHEATNAESCSRIDQQHRRSQTVQRLQGLYRRPHNGIVDAGGDLDAYEERASGPEPPPRAVARNRGDRKHQPRKSPTRAYVARRTAEGKSKPEIIRCLKRLVARVLYQAIVNPPKDLPSSYELRQRRLQAGRSLTQVSAALGTAPITFSRLERGRLYDTRLARQHLEWLTQEPT